MNSSTDAIISIALDRQAEKVRQVQGTDRLQRPGLSQSVAVRPALALATTIVVIGAALAFAIR